MESFKIENLNFSYPSSESKALKNINLTVDRGEFVTLCGRSGCGKTTLMRLLKPLIAPFGQLEGNILFEGKPVSELSEREQASRIGFVFQDPDNGIVADKVWHELAFGLESLGLPAAEIRTRVAETVSYFGIGDIFYRKVSELSGGQKQILNLASVLIMQPSALILDEPTSQLDPVSATDFLNTLSKINKELGITVIISEHRLEEAIPLSDRVVFLEKGEIVADGTPGEVGRILKESGNRMFDALPTPMRVYGETEKDTEFPVSVREGRKWLEEYSLKNTLYPERIPEETRDFSDETAVELKDVYFRYDRELPDVLKGFDLKVEKSSFFAVVGGNGAGKTTALSVIAGLNPAYRGKVLINGEKIENIKNLYKEILGYLPQDPQDIFVKKTVYEDLYETASKSSIPEEEREEKIAKVTSLCRIGGLTDRHPYDLSGGEQQRAALAKVLLKDPKILLLDEPTKGMDACFKKEFAAVIKRLNENGVTVIAVSHDIEFCAEYADKCALMFDGGIISTGLPKEFFSGNNFYTTAANRMARGIIPGAVTAGDIILACGGSPKPPENDPPELTPPPEKAVERVKKNKFKIITGIVFALLFIATCVYQLTVDKENGSFVLPFVSLIEISAAFLCLIPKKKFEIKNIRQPENNGFSRLHAAVALITVLLAIPFTVYAGIRFFGNRKYYFISLIIILETFVPFLMIFEKRKPKARELVVISVLCALAIAGRVAFYAIPQFKPVAAIVIIAGICFGCETGFLTGAVSAFISNFFFGQGPWTPWQMFAFGIIGFIAGILFKKGFPVKTKTALCLFGFFAVLIIYGVIMNTYNVIITQPVINFDMIKAACLTGLPFDIIHAASTFFFLWFISEPMFEKLERVKVKYGLIS